MNNLLDTTLRNAFESAIPDATLTVSEWAEKYRVVSRERVADPGLAGKWSNSVTPYLVGIMDAVTDAFTNEIVFIKSSQVGGTEFLNNVIGYFIHIDPATILYVCENEGKARAWSVESFAPMIRDTPVLRDIFGEAKSRDSSNMIEAKKFRGGHFALAWSTSPATLSSRPRRIILTDESDAFTPTKEGDPIKLAEARTKTAGEMRKIIHVTTPRNKEHSRILPQYEASSAEKYFVPCPHCDEMQELVWTDETGYRIFDDDGETEAYYVCVNGCIIEHSYKLQMIADGEWRSTNPEYSGNRRGFWINELYSPFTSWQEMLDGFREAKQFRDTLQTFINTRLAEFWEEEGDVVEYQNIEFNREEYEFPVPDGVLCITAGVDVQDDRLEMEVVGWGENLENWSLDYNIIEGSPTNPEVWDDLYNYLTNTWHSHTQEFGVSAVCIDSGGHHTNEVYKFCKANSNKRWWAIKGSSVSNNPIAPKKPSLAGNQKVRLFSIGTDTAKDEIFAFLKNEKAGSSGYCHFPDTYEQWYFKQLCAEKKITVWRMGVASQKYVKVTESARNEALDCRVYATAAREILRPNFDKIASNLGQKAKKVVKTSEDVQDKEEKVIQPKYRRFTANLNEQKADWR